jgi:hypothetical protein
VVCVSCVSHRLNDIFDRGSTRDPCLVIVILAQCVFEDLLCFCKDVRQDCITAAKVSFVVSGVIHARLHDRRSGGWRTSQSRCYTTLELVGAGVGDKVCSEKRLPFDCVRLMSSLNQSLNVSRCKERVAMDLEDHGISCWADSKADRPQSQKVTEQ